LNLSSAYNDLSGAIAINDAVVNVNRILTVGSVPYQTGNITITGQIPGISPNITTDFPYNGTLVVGSSTTNPYTVFVRDNDFAGSGKVDIFSGVGLGLQSVRIQGASNGHPSPPFTPSNNPRVSTNVEDTTGILELTSSFEDANPAIQITNSGININRVVSVSSALAAQSTFTGVSSGAINSGSALVLNVEYSIPNPANAGLYTIMIKYGNNTAINIDSQISATGYWSGAVWVCGGCATSPVLGDGVLIIDFGLTATTTAQLVVRQDSTRTITNVSYYMFPLMTGLTTIIT